MHRGARVAHSLALAPIAALAAALVAAPGGASAGPNDLVLARLGTRVLDGSGNVTSVVGDSLELRALASQLGVVLAPSLLTPADTLGLSGIQLSLIGGQTSISASEDYWRARAGSPDPAGAGGVAHGPSGLRTIGAALHKGLWFPLPSFELGVGAVHLLDSSIWAVQASAKLALVEGYHDLPLPSLAVRGAVSRMMNQRELDLTVASFEALVSKHFGVGGTWRLDPFAGWNLLMIIPRTAVIEGTPNVDPLTMGSEMDLRNNFVFRDQDAIFRHRLVGGVKLQLDVVQLTVEVQHALAGRSRDDRAGTTDVCAPRSTTTACDSPDTAAAQTTVSASAGFDF